MENGKWKIYKELKINNSKFYILNSTFLAVGWAFLPTTMKNKVGDR